MTDNNFTNQILAKLLQGSPGGQSGYDTKLKSYLDLVNQAHPTEAWGDAFESQAKGMSSEGPGNQMTKAFLSGMGAGFKGISAYKKQKELEHFKELTADLTNKSADYETQMQQEQLNAMKKVSPYMEQASKIAAQNAYFEAQLNQEKMRKQSGENFVRGNISLITALGKASTAGDQDFATKIARELGNKYQKAFNTKLGEFDSYDADSRRIFYKNGDDDDTVTGFSITDAIREYADDVYGDQAPYVMRELDPYYKEQYQDSRIQASATLQEKQLKNQKTQEEIYELQQELQNPKLTPEEAKARESATRFNRELIRDKIQPQLEANENMLDIMEAISDIIDDSPNIAGSDLKTKAWRSLGESLGLDPNIDYAKLKSVEFEKMLRPILGGQFGEKEGERVLGKFISIDKHPEAAKQFIEEEVPKLTDKIVRGNMQIVAFNEKQHVNLYDSAIYKNLDKEKFSYEYNRKDERQERRDGTNSVNNASSGINNDLSDLPGAKRLK